MTERSPPAPGKPAGEAPADRRAAEREARLAAALRSNLRRRKAQSLARQDAAGEALDQRTPPKDAEDRGQT